MNSPKFVALFDNVINSHSGICLDAIVEKVRVTCDHDDSAVIEFVKRCSNFIDDYDKSYPGFCQIDIDRFYSICIALLGYCQNSQYEFIIKNGRVDLQCGINRNYSKRLLISFIFVMSLKVSRPPCRPIDALNIWKNDLQDYLSDNSQNREIKDHMDVLAGHGLKLPRYPVFETLGKKGVG